MDTENVAGNYGNALGASAILRPILGRLGYGAGLRKAAAARVCSYPATAMDGFVQRQCVRSGEHGLQVVWRWVTVTTIMPTMHVYLKNPLASVAAEGVARTQTERSKRRWMRQPILRS